jgi:hypothetical protein
MLEVFVKLITSKLAGPILGVALLGSIIGNGVLGFKLHSANSALSDAQAEVTRLTVDNANLRVNQATLKLSIGNQNAGVDRLKLEAELSAANAAKMQAQANLAAAGHLQRAGTIAASKPSDPNDLCASASHLITSVLSTESK